MPAETLKCPFCEKEMELVPEELADEEYNCTNEKCGFKYWWHYDGSILKIQELVTSCKQKSYSEGYEKCKKEMQIKLEQQEKVFIALLPVVALKDALEKSKDR